MHHDAGFDVSSVTPPSVALRTRAVQLDLEAFDEQLKGDTARLKLEIFEDVILELRPDHATVYSRWLSAWSGRLGDGSDPAAWYTLTRNRDLLVANFWLADGRAFEIRPVDDFGVTHLVHEIQPDLFAPCMTCEALPDTEPLRVPEPILESMLSRNCEDDGSVIDVLIVYTPSARAAAGGTAAIQSLAVSSIQSTNQAYINSGIHTSVRLVHLAEVDYSETGNYSNDLFNLRSGAVPGVLDLRETYNADLVAMLNNSPGGCGVAYLMQTLSPGFEANGFSVTRYSCAVGNLTFAHELGHNMGCQHDAANANSSPLFPYSYGWRWNTSNGQVRRSVMAYSPGSRVPHFSNPDVTNGGAPTGDPSVANNALSINNAAYVVSNFRISDCEQSPGECAWGDLAGGFTGTVLALTQHTDTSGTFLYAAGTFIEAGGQTVSNIARWDGDSWSPFGSGINGTVHDLHSIPSGPLAGLYASGFFTNAGGVTVSNIARWNGSSWSPLGSGLNNRVRAMNVYDDGSGPALYAAGTFTGSGGVAANRIARWDGSSWSPLGSGLDGVIYALEVFDDGTGPALYAAGSPSTAGGVPTSNIARWDGNQWSSVGDGLNSFVQALAVFDDGSGASLYAGGRFDASGTLPANGIARWDGENWSSVGAGLGSEVLALLAFEDPDGPALFAAGDFVVTTGFIPTSGIAVWNGTDWDRLGSGLAGTANALASTGPQLGRALFVGGSFASAGSQQTDGIARWGCPSILCPADVNGSGSVDLDDLNIVLTNFGQTTSEGDTNGDGVVDLNDLNAVLTAFGTDCP